MACPPTNVKFQFRRDTAVNWKNTDHVLTKGEPGFEIDTYKLKVGIGYNWNKTPYVNSIPTISPVYNDPEIANENLLNYDITRVLITTKCVKHTIRLPEIEETIGFIIRIQNMLQDDLHVVDNDNQLICIMNDEIVSFLYNGDNGWIFLATF
jgi:hypothetical protein